MMEISLQPNPDETPWIDAWIRWERDAMGTDDSDEDDDYQPESPTHTFACRYAGTSQCPAIDISLRGFPSDSQETWNSTGLTLWRSSEHLCEYLVKEASSPRGLFAEHQRFLELGSGLGRSGILALHCLSIMTNNNIDDDSAGGEPRRKFLCLTDGDTDVLRQLRENVQQNQPCTNKSNNDTKEEGNANHTTPTPIVTVNCSQLRWGYESTKAFLPSVDQQPFDVIFGSDLIYVAKNIPPLFETVTTLLAPKQESLCTCSSSCFIMAHCTRREGNEVSVEMVLEAAESFGLEHSVVEEDDDISLFVFRWKRN
uniref:Calmodulin-lysine N-methyltransferase n=1 Tax=Amphora coffeiformis TaxID=265554 RepID=A0A7S3LBD1_9STRA